MKFHKVHIAILKLCIRNKANKFEFNAYMFDDLRTDLLGTVT